MGVGPAEVSFRCRLVDFQLGSPSWMKSCLGNAFRQRKDSCHCYDCQFNYQSLTKPHKVTHLAFMTNKLSNYWSSGRLQSSIVDQKGLDLVGN